MKSYQNTMQSLKASTFIEIGSFSGTEVAFKASSPITKVGQSQVTFAKGAVSVRMPHDVTPCETACPIGTVTESISIDFNVVDPASLDVLKAEVDRIFAATKATLVRGILPPVYSTFTEE